MQCSTVLTVELDVCGDGDGVVVVVGVGPDAGELGVGVVPCQGLQPHGVAGLAGSDLLVAVVDHPAVHPPRDSGGRGRPEHVAGQDQGGHLVERGQLSQGHPDAAAAAIVAVASAHHLAVDHQSGRVQDGRRLGRNCENKM